MNMYIQNKRILRLQKTVGMALSMSLVIVAALVFSLLFSVRSVYASEKISNIYVSVRENSSEAGVIYPIEVTSSYNTYVEDISYSKDYDDWSAGNTVTIVATISPNNASFSKDTKVSASGAKLSTYSYKSGKIKVTLVYTPKMKLTAPEGLYMDDDTLYWDKVSGNPDYEVYAEIVTTYYDDDGNERTKNTNKTVTTSDISLDASSYLTDDESQVKFKVRAVPKTKQKDYLYQSDWSEYGGDISISDENTVYGQFSGSGNTLRFIDNSGSYVSGWQYINKAWYYFDSNNNNYAVSGWQLINNVWYYFDSNTRIMSTGWVLIDNYWYYFYSSGAMATNWIQIGPNGNWYYMGTNGAMWKNVKTPDGYYVNDDGVWIVNLR